MRLWKAAGGAAEAPYAATGAWAVEAPLRSELGGSGPKVASQGAGEQPTAAAPRRAPIHTCWRTDGVCRVLLNGSRYCTVALSCARALSAAFTLAPGCSQQAIGIECAYRSLAESHMCRARSASAACGVARSRWRAQNWLATPPATSAWHSIIAAAFSRLASCSTTAFI